MSEWKQLEDQFQVKTYARWEDVFLKGEGHLLTAESGKQFVDLYGGHCVTILGHSHPEIAEAIYAQSKELAFYSNVTYSPIRAKAAEKLIQLAPIGFDKVYFCNSGTEANENALKLAWKLTGKSLIAATFGGWHGRTLASLAATDDPPIRDPYLSVLPEVVRVPFGDAAALEQLFASRSDIAAFILEPIQSMAGITTAPAEYFKDIRALCTKYGVKLIFDEIQTGVGRTGKFSYSEWVGIQPDFITMAKSLANGLPVGAVLMSDATAALVKSGDLGSTFAGGMIPMAACLETLSIIERDGLMKKAQTMFSTLSKAFEGTSVEVLGAGCLMGLKFPFPVADMVKKLYQRGYLTGKSSNPQVMRLMPPVTTPLHVVVAFADVVKEELSR